MPRILLTGATGFIGRHCIAPLRSSGWQVLAVTSGTVDELPCNEGLSWHRADLLDPRAPAELIAQTRPDALLHLAWHLAASSVENYRWARASLELLMAFAEAGGRRAVLTGSCAEYDWLQSQPLDEQSRRRPATDYGVSKNALGELVEGYRTSCGLSTAWARLFFLYGPGEAETRLVASVIRALLADQPARSTHGNQLRDYLYVEDVAGALVQLVASEIEGPINIASGRSVRLRDLIAEAATQLDRQQLVELGAIAAHEHEAPEVSAEVKRLHRELEWQPAFDHRQGIARSIAWWRQQMARASQ